MKNTVGVNNPNKWHIKIMISAAAQDNMEKMEKFTGSLKNFFIIHGETNADSINGSICIVPIIMVYVANFWASTSPVVKSVQYAHLI